MMLVATVVAVACTVSGLLLSYGLGDLSRVRPGAGISMPPGPLIVLLAATVYGLSSLLRRATGRA
jgi:ABC-type Mn2+/Zn2+ transport system permease subunit